MVKVELVSPWPAVAANSRKVGRRLLTDRVELASPWPDLAVLLRKVQAGWKGGLVARALPGARTAFPAECWRRVGGALVLALTRNRSSPALRVSAWALLLVANRLPEWARLGPGAGR